MKTQRQLPMGTRALFVVACAGILAVLATHGTAALVTVDLAELAQDSTDALACLSDQKGLNLADAQPVFVCDAIPSEKDAVSACVRSINQSITAGTVAPASILVTADLSNGRAMNDFGTMLNDFASALPIARVLINITKYNSNPFAAHMDVASVVRRAALTLKNAAARNGGSGTLPEVGLWLPDHRVCAPGAALGLASTRTLQMSMSRTTEANIVLAFPGLDDSSSNSICGFPDDQIYVRRAKTIPVASTFSSPACRAVGTPSKVFGAFQLVHATDNTDPDVVFTNDFTHDDL